MTQPYDSDTAYTPVPVQVYKYRELEKARLAEYKARHQQSLEALDAWEEAHPDATDAQYEEASRRIVIGKVKSTVDKTNRQMRRHGGGKGVGTEGRITKDLAEQIEKHDIYVTELVQVVKRKGMPYARRIVTPPLNAHVGTLALKRIERTIRRIERAA